MQDRFDLDDNDDTQSRPNQVDAQRNKLERSDGTVYSPSTHDEATESHRAEATAGCSENADSEAMIEENCVANVRVRNNNKHGRPQHQKQFNRVHKQRPSLLQKVCSWMLYETVKVMRHTYQFTTVPNV